MQYVLLCVLHLLQKLSHTLDCTVQGEISLWTSWLLVVVQKDKDGDVEVPAEDNKESPKEPAEAAPTHSQAVAAAAAARKLNSSTAAAEHVRIAAIRRAAEFVKVRLMPSIT